MLANESGTHKARSTSEMIGFDAGLRKGPAYRPQIRLACISKLSILGIWHTVRTQNSNKGLSPSE